MRLFQQKKTNNYNSIKKDELIKINLYNKLILTKKQNEKLWKVA